MKQLHGLRHNMKFGKFIADTKRDDNWVMLKLNGVAVLRQAKESSGKFFRQGINPDYKGFDGFPLEFLKDGNWRSWDRASPKGAIRFEANRILED